MIETVTKTKELKPEVLALSEKMSSGFTINAKEGSSVAKDDLYASTLPENLTMETIKSVRDHDTNFVAAGAHAFGTLAVAAMAKHNKCDKLTVEVPMCGKDSITYSVNRFEDTVNHLGNGETIRKYGVIKPTLDMKAGKNGGQLKLAKKIIGELAMAALKK